MNKIKRQLTKQNLILLILVSLGGHNYYLQTKIDDSINAANDAEYEANQAKNYASDAADYASDAADYASDAASEASDASSYAYDAYINSFGNQCYNCPSW